MPRAKLLFLLSFFLLYVATVQAQQSTADPRNIDASAFGERIDISSAWLFSPVDDPANAAPGFDDRAWPVISTRRALDSYGFHDYSVGWYRVHVHLPAKARNVVLVLGTMSGQYQAFANGVQIAGPADLHSTLGRLENVNVDYRIPDDVLRASAGDLVVALRVAPNRTAGKAEDRMRNAKIYLVSADAAPRDASYVATHTVAASIVKGALAFLVFLVSLALYLAIRAHPEYLAAAASLYLTFSLNIYIIAIALKPYNYVGNLLTIVGVAVICVTQAEFVRLVLKLPRTRFFVAAQVFIFVAGASFVSYYGMAKTGHHVLIYLWYTSPALALDLLLLLLLIPAFRRRNPDAFILLPLMCVSFIDDFWNLLAVALNNLSHPVALPNLPALHIASYSLNFSDLDQLVFTCGILLFLVLRTIRIAREGVRVTAEIEAAQSMQQLLLARSSEAMPGFDIESVYLPASQVGGDFFLVSPNPADGSLTAILGDVSGKGLTAAMRVAMILGILRREDSRDPATILLRLNEALLSQGDAGFTTACCVRLQPDGSFIVANAGHISPYVSGAELETAPGLPLGLAPGQEYQELFGRLTAGARMVLMSDGIVEARSKTGELYGFDRLNALTQRPAKEIAATAQAFGQDDDITVLTLACTA